MTGHEEDLDFSECCVHCPYFEPVGASCTHDLRQALVQEMTDTRSCSVYSRAKTASMRDLSSSLR